MKDVSIFRFRSIYLICCSSKNFPNPTLSKFRIEHYFSTTEKTEEKPCCIRVQIIIIAMVSDRDSENVTCVEICNVYGLLET